MAGNGRRRCLSAAPKKFAYNRYKIETEHRYVLLQQPFAGCTKRIICKLHGYLHPKIGVTINKWLFVALWSAKTLSTARVCRLNANGICQCESFATTLSGPGQAISGALVDSHQFIDCSCHSMLAVKFNECDKINTH